MPANIYQVLPWLAVLFSCACTGCANNEFRTYPVSGHLEFEDGTAPKFGTIEFFNADRKINARGKIDRDGSFTVGTYQADDGAVEGQHKVIISQPTRDPLTAQIKVEIEHDHGTLVHPDYYDYRTSKLNCQVTATSENNIRLIIKKHPAETAE
jgi:hypothetical protein